MTIGFSDLVFSGLICTTGLLGPFTQFSKKPPPQEPIKPDPFNT